MGILAICYINDHFNIAHFAIYAIDKTLEILPYRVAAYVNK
jgi:hypothetical protein